MGECAGDDVERKWRCTDYSSEWSRWPLYLVGAACRLVALCWRASAPMLFAVNLLDLVHLFDPLVAPTLRGFAFSCENTRIGVGFPASILPRSPRNNRGISCAPSMIHRVRELRGLPSGASMPVFTQGLLLSPF